jgi:ubiquinone/menaquinone biosynthesis C-methylase UbiE
MDIENIRKNHEGIERQKQGISSFKRLDVEKIFTNLNLKEGEVFFDIGCGSGDYSLMASKLVGKNGKVYALDQWEEIDIRLKSLNVGNIFPLVGNIEKNLPLANNSCDICFVAMVLHGVDLELHGEKFFSEIYRILKPKGRIAIIEIKKEETPFGPPMEIRFSPDQLENMIKKFGFQKSAYTDLGYCYMIQFEAQK